MSVNKDLSLLKAKKNTIQRKTKNSVTAIPAIKDKGKIKSNIVKFWIFKYFIENYFKNYDFTINKLLMHLIFLSILFIIIDCFF